MFIPFYCLIAAKLIGQMQSFTELARLDELLDLKLEKFERLEKLDKNW